MPITPAARKLRQDDPAWAIKQDYQKEMGMEAKNGGRELFGANG